MSNKKGTLIFWEISDFQTTKEELERLGYGNYLPRNDHRAAMIKAMKAVTKGNDKFYRRKGDKFAVLVQTESEDVDVHKEIGFRLDEKTGFIEWNGQSSAAIQDAYNNSQRTINADQLRKAILKIVKAECYGVSMRKSGGIYFVDEQFNETLENLKRLFRAFPKNTRLHEIPIYDDASTLDAIEEATGSEVFEEIESLISVVKEQFEQKSITVRQLEGRQKDAAEIMNKIKIHEQNLRSRHSALVEKIAKASTALELVWSRVDEAIYDPEDFMKALEKV